MEAFSGAHFNHSAFNRQYITSRHFFLGRVNINRSPGDAEPPLAASAAAASRVKAVCVEGEVGAAGRVSTMVGVPASREKKKSAHTHTTAARILYILPYDNTTDNKRLISDNK